MSESKLETFQKKCLAFKEVTLVGPLARTLSLDNKERAILAVDGGANHHSFDLSIGDGDSSTQKLDLKAPVDKNQSDLALALEIIPPGVSVCLYGFWGERLDHQLTVLGEISHWHQKRGQKITLYGPGPERLEAYQSGRYSFNHRGLFSVLSLYRGVFSLSGDLRYPLVGQEIAPLSSHLLSNQAEGEFLVESSVAFFLYFGESP